ncbi:MAG: hypothetical protein MHMPM18_004289 [Marteilia pararefringens]
MSSQWLTEGKISPFMEASVSMMQDRNLFWLIGQKCLQCAEITTVDHQATKCGRLVRHEYTQRYDEVVRCLVTQLKNKFGFTRSRRAKDTGHSIAAIYPNERAEIRVDQHFPTNLKLKHTKPDIYLRDKRSGNITIFEVGITSQSNLLTVEHEKTVKYEMLTFQDSYVHPPRSPRHHTSQQAGENSQNNRNRHN